MIKIPDWKARKSIRVYSQSVDFPFSFGPLSEPVQLFGIYYMQDGSLYVEHFAPADIVEYNRVVNGEIVEQIQIPVALGTKLKTSFHGSGEVVGIERSKSSTTRSHLGFALREIASPTLIAEFVIGSGGHYLGMFDTYEPPHKRSLVIEGILETTALPVFGLWAGPVGTDFPVELELNATAGQMKQGNSISIGLSLKYVPMEQRPLDPRLIAYIKPFHAD